MLPNILKRKSSSRNITPPSTSALDADTYTTRPHLIKKAQEGPSPDDEIIGSPTFAPLGQPALSEPQYEVLTIEPRDGLGRSITGADRTVPIFDGRSTDPKDCLIELDDASMEKIPDVRAYFWTVGEYITPPGGKSIVEHTLEEARVYDDEMVRKGRLYIRACRDQGIGFYLNKNRDFSSYGQPGSAWYRMAAFGIVQDLLFNGPLQGQTGEGYFKDQSRRPQHHCTPQGAVLTNIRIPILWAEFATETYRPGTATWDGQLISAFSTYSPIMQLVTGDDWEYLMMDDEFIRLDDRYIPYTHDDVMAIVKRDWPNQYPKPPTPPSPPPKMLEFTKGGKPKNFFKDDYKEKGPLRTKIGKMGKKMGSKQ